MSRFDASRPAGERMAAVETWAENHDDECSKRWGILLKLIGFGGSAALVVVIGLIGFGGKALYDQQQQQNNVIAQYIQRHNK
jgi:hypothetical protein